MQLLMPHKQPLRQTVLELIGIAGNVNLVETQHRVEVVDPGHILVMDVGLDSVPHIAAQQLLQPRRGEIALHGGRANVNPRLEIRTIEARSLQRWRDAAG